ncbi:MAG: hypothetical protein E6G10_23570 [Actinobacteria bacterium]|nr:MAG: hypothetical protein E6G10_23570 [Actinomycetota bacterium]
MRSTRLLLTLTAIGAAALPVAGADAASRLSLRVANKAADKAAAEVVDTYTDDSDATIDSYDLSPCERDTRRRADCDVTYVFDDGTECDDTIHVRLAARGRIKVTADSDDAGDHVFDDCTEPDDTGDTGDAGDTSTDEGDLGGGDISVEPLPVDDPSTIY